MIGKDGVLKNVVTFLGDESTIRQVRKILWCEVDGEHDIVFNPSSICPIPEEAMKHGELDKFCQENWGCSSIFMNDREISLNCISFETEEHPPRKVFKRLAEMYPDISILVEFARYDGKGFDSEGVILYKNNEIKDGMLLPSYSKILLEQVQGDKFSVLHSCVLHQDKEEKVDLKPLLSKLMSNELDSMQKVYNIIDMTCHDSQITSSSAIVRQIEKNYNTLDKLLKLYENTLDKEALLNQTQEKSQSVEADKVKSEEKSVLDMGHTTALQDWKNGGKANSSVSSKATTKSGSYIPQRSVLTKPKYRSVNPKNLKKNNNTKKNDISDYEK